jgi:hypothetical protein
VSGKPGIECEFGRLDITARYKIFSNKWTTFKNWLIKK